MLCRRCGLCSRRNRKINIVLGGRGGNVTKTLKNRILLISVSTLLSPIVDLETAMYLIIVRAFCCYKISVCHTLTDEYVEKAERH